MKKIEIYKVAFFAAVGLLLPISCGAGTGTKAEQINGAEVYNNNCTRCHNARPATEFSDREWDVVVPHMRDRAHLTGPESRAVLMFLQLSNRPEITKLPASEETSEDTSQKPETTHKKKKPRTVGNPAVGRSLVKRYQCTGCHKINGAGGSLGPSLNGVVRRKGAGFVYKKIRNPKFNKPSSAMPKFPLSRSQILSIVEYLKTL